MPPKNHTALQKQGLKIDRKEQLLSDAAAAKASSVSTARALSLGWFAGVPTGNITKHLFAPATATLGYVASCAQVLYQAYSAVGTAQTGVTMITERQKFDNIALSNNQILTTERVTSIGKLIVSNLPQKRREDVIKHINDKIPHKVQDRLIDLLHNDQLSTSEIKQAFDGHAPGLLEQMQNDVLSIEQGKQQELLRYFTKDKNQQASLMEALIRAKETRSTKQSADQSITAFVQPSNKHSVMDTISAVSQAAQPVIQAASAAGSAYGMIATAAAIPALPAISAAAAVVSIAATAASFPVLPAINDLSNLRNFRQTVSTKLNIQDVNAQLMNKKSVMAIGEVMESSIPSNTMAKFIKAVNDQMPVVEQEALLNALEKGELTIGKAQDVFNKHTPKLLTQIQDEVLSLPKSVSNKILPHLVKTQQHQGALLNILSEAKAQRSGGKSWTSETKKEITAQKKGGYKR